MKNQFVFVKSGLVVMMAVLAVGCGNGFRSGGDVGGVVGGQGAQSQPNIDDTMSKVEAATVEAQQAMADADAAIASISDSNGNIKISLFSSSGTSSKAVSTQGLLAPLVAKLKPVFDTVFSKVSLVKEKIDVAKGLLQDALTKLDPNSQAAQLILQQLARIADLEAKFSTQMHRLADKLDLALDGIDRIVNLATSFIPIPGLGLIAGQLIDMYLVDDVKDLITDLQAKLLAL